MTPEDMDKEDIIRLLRLLRDQTTRTKQTLTSLATYAKKHRATNLADDFLTLQADALSLERKLSRLAAKVRHPAPLQ